MTGLNGEPLYTLTVEEFVQLLDERINAALKSEGTKKTLPSGNYVYGLRGIEQLFGVSHKTAQYYKDHIINEAVMQNGRKSWSMPTWLFKSLTKGGQNEPAGITSRRLDDAV